MSWIENISKGMANGLSSLWSNCKQYFVSFVNGVIELINSMIRRINNKLKISVGSTLASILQGLGINVRGGYYQLFSIPELPKLQTGTNKIPEDGPYYLHKNEAVVPKKYNPAVGGGNNEELLSKHPISNLGVDPILTKEIDLNAIYDKIRTGNFSDLKSNGTYESFFGNVFPLCIFYRLP